jgi:transposase-like protein
MLEGLRTPTEVIVMVVTLLAYGCPLQAVVHAFGLDERTVAEWQKRAGKQCQQVHHAIVEQGKMASSQVQVDEIRAKGRKPIAWMGLAIDATSRLWMAGVVSARRDRSLADRLLHQVRACCQARHALLICTDGWAPYPFRAMQDVRLMRERNGAFGWLLSRNRGDEERHIEAFLAESWADYLRQLGRMTHADHAIEDRARSFHQGSASPPVTTFIAEYLHLHRAPDTF